MNVVDALLRTPFSQLPLEQKLEVQRLGPYQPKDCSLEQSHYGGKHRRTFCAETWYKKHEWLCYSEDKIALFCFYCLLFATTRDSRWCKFGFRDLKHLSQRARDHQSSMEHLDNAVKYRTIGNVNIAAQLDEGRAFSIRRHNQNVEKNRHVLGRLIDVLKFIGCHELSLRGHDERAGSSNRGVFLDMVEYTASLDTVLRDHLDAATVSKGTSKDIQNDLLDSMYKIYLQHLALEIENCQFLSIQSDETTDITCVSQLAVIFRFVKDGKPTERFHSFVPIVDRTACGISAVLKEVLQPYNAKSKLIAQTYDGAAVMSRLFVLQDQ
ncbi:zinc finger MYM-type protein 1-like [Styela clava]